MRNELNCCSPVHDELFFFSCCFRDFLLVLGFQQFVYVDLGVALLVLILLRMYWASWICRFIFFIKFGKVLAIISYNIFSIHFSLYSPFRIPITDMLLLLVSPHISAHVHRLFWPGMCGIFGCLGSLLDMHIAWGQPRICRKPSWLSYLLKLLDKSLVSPALICFSETGLKPQINWDTGPLCLPLRWSLQLTMFQIKYAPSSISSEAADCRDIDRAEVWGMGWEQP